MLVLTLNVTLAVLGDHTCAILLVPRPLVNIQSCVWRSSIQDDPVLQSHRTHRTCRRCRRALKTRGSRSEDALASGRYQAETRLNSNVGLQRTPSVYLCGRRTKASFTRFTSLTYQHKQQHRHPRFLLIFSKGIDQRYIATHATSIKRRNRYGMHTRKL